MNLGWSAVTLSGHLMIIYALVCALFNAAAAHQSWDMGKDRARMVLLKNPAFAVGAALAVERVYYVLARLLVNTPIDLWEAHPAPDVLSLMVSVPVLWLAVNIRKLAGPLDNRCQMIVRLQLCSSIVLFLAVSLGLW